ncbi:hypothetical protein P3875_05000 [Myroides sp. JBRI-B21084]|uniref:hypothetical protein n=1 Tax=Myroides sp. JBRI-B21084 TaxID=3119977 RepID=UPI0026E209B0|nr:hypothetical protein [Paenimyroides cloacae]WKW47422.1 hypothetical protein P3875_05000 [Paenimyroides cloacae]
MNTLFTENQRFNQWWLWLLIVVITIIPVIDFFKKFTNNTVSKETIFGVIILLLSILFLVIIKLKTTITPKTIQVTFFPLINKNIEINTIKSMNVINYGFVGGWGIRLFTKYGIVYNIKGKMGLHIQLKNGKQLIIGTQKPTELSKIISQINLQ